MIMPAAATLRRRIIFIYMYLNCDRIYNNNSLLNRLVPLNFRHDFRLSGTIFLRLSALRAPPRRALLSRKDHKRKCWE